MYNQTLYYLYIILSYILLFLCFVRKYVIILKIDRNIIGVLLWGL